MTKATLHRWPLADSLLMVLSPGASFSTTMNSGCQLLAVMTSRVQLNVSYSKIMANKSKLVVSGGQLPYSGGLWMSALYSCSAL